MEKAIEKIEGINDIKEVLLYDDNTIIINSKFKRKLKKDSYNHYYFTLNYRDFSFNAVANYLEYYKLPFTK